MGSRVFVAAVGVLLCGCLAPVDEVDGGAPVAGGVVAGGAAAGGQGGGAQAGGASGGQAGGQAGGSGGGRAGGSAGGGPACRRDADCAPGELCYDCGSFSACDVGCSASTACPRGSTCVAQSITCLTCPCPQSRCEAPACIDLDNDGYLPQQCQGIPGGDCAPFDGTIFPGARENCGNGRDDDCDGLVDSADPSCVRSCGAAPSCTSSLACTLGMTTCHAGCCQPCPLMSPPLCPFGQCLSPGAPDPLTGCFVDVRCVPCGACPDVHQPVCAHLGVGDARTFGNRCEALTANAIVIHDGSCVSGEGLSCAPNGPGCLPGTYCRDACPVCDIDENTLRCAKVGACLTAIDCPAGAPPPPPMSCANGSPAPMACVDNACVRRCAP